MKSILAFLVVIILAGCGGEPQSPQQTASPSPAAMQKAPDEPAALAVIAGVNSGQMDYFARNRRYALTYDELIEMFFLKEEPAIEKTGYDIRLRPAADAASYVILAGPSTPSPEVRHFFSDQTGTIRAEQGKEANAQSPAISQ